MNTSEKLYRLRRERGLSQEQAAEQLGVSRQAVSKWESGQSVPDTDKLAAISRLYGVSLDALLLGDAAVPDAPTPAPERAASQSDRPRPTKAGLALCLLGAVGLLAWAAVVLFAPDAAQQVDASSAVTLRGAGLWALACLGALIAGAAVLLRNR